ncbi:phage late control D family protein [Pseudooceanicola sp. MF1-13]|uniref:phage late control D family protein n=1 Tax=Pseudooceanicola sp. MF1-13 TaxID=3379095 RepID=UPI003892537F
MTHPKVLVDIDGVPVSGLFFERLVSLTITDREGIRSDTLEMTFSDAAPHFASPRRGAVASVTIQSGAGGAFAGAYVIDRVDHKCLPYTITVSGHSADLRSEMKTQKSRHWDDTSVRDIVAEIAGEYGLDPKISDAVSGHVYPWIGQQDESDLNFLERVANRHGALFTIKNGALLWLERGAGKTADGTSVSAAVIIPTSIVEGSCRVSEGDVDRFAKVKAFYQDRGNAKRRVVIVDCDPEADGEHVMRDPFGSEAEAQLAAEACAREMKRGLVQTSCAIVGRPALMAGQPLTYLGVRPGVDGREFITEMVKHSYTKSGGLRTSFEGRLKAE